jgi:hypothetical protein
MSGRMSRNKGKRNEYLLRDYFRRYGWDANRVPSSGAAQGFKGDITLSKGNIKLTAECKARQNEFKSIYAEHVEKNVELDAENKLVGTIYTTKGMSVIVSYDFNALGYETSCAPMQGTMTPRTLKKLFGLHKFLKTCDLLVIRIDRKPFLFIRFIQ